MDVDKWDYMLRSSPRLGRRLLGKWRKFCHFLSWESIPQMYVLQLLTIYTQLPSNKNRFPLSCLSIDIVVTRDAAAMDVKTIFNYQRFINNSDITLVEGRMRLCIRDKEKENVGYLFQDRSRLHKNYYQHKTVKVVDRMTVDALLLADPHLALLGRDAAGRVLRMSEACDDVADFLKLSDDFVLRSIQFSEGPELAAARRLVTRIATRNLYKLVGEVTNAPGSAAACERQMNDIIRQERERGVPMNLVVGDVVVTKKKIGFGGVQNPLEKVIFFDKRGRAITCPVTEVMEAVATVDTLLVMCKRSQEETLAIQEAKDLFEKWMVQEQGDKVI